MSDYVNRLTAFSHDLKGAGNEVKDADFILTLVTSRNQAPNICCIRTSKQRKGRTTQSKTARKSQKNAINSQPKH